MMDMELSFLINTPLNTHIPAIRKLLLGAFPPDKKWLLISQQYLNPQLPFELHLSLYRLCYAKENFKPIWSPNNEVKTKSYLGRWLNQLNLANVSEFYRYSIEAPHAFWGQAIDDLKLHFQQLPTATFDMSLFPYPPTWLPHSRFNIAQCCIHPKDALNDKTAIVFKGLRYGKTIQESVSYAKLGELVLKIAKGLKRQYQLKAQETVAIILPMNIEAIAMYLAVIYLGATVVSIADSFSETEISKRLNISHCKIVFTQDIVIRGDKPLMLYQKLIACQAQSIICLITEQHALNLRPCDIGYDCLLDNIENDETPDCYMQSAQESINILFSSGTTGTPKAIVWEQSTALKIAIDAKLYMDTNLDDIWAWPTNLGWMMGPWLVFAVLLNRATLVLTEDIPSSLAFAQFIENNKVTKLGVIPSIVNSWRNQGVLEQVNWQNIELFASTGEASNVEDMFYLSLHAGYKPIIEYCGGTEIGGAYISSTLLQPNVPSQFSQVCFGIELKLLDDQQQIPSQTGQIIGESALSSCAPGLSNRLLNADNNEVYYHDMPIYKGNPLRRHGDLLQRFTNGYYRSMGRADNTMNLGGIKTSSAEIEQALLTLDNIYELAAVAVNDENQGMSKLVIYVAPKTQLDPCFLKSQMQRALKELLNPLFKISDVILIEKLPRTASNKIIHRELKAHYEQYCQNSPCC